MAHKRSASSEPLTLGDRLGCGLLSGVFGLGLGAVIWWGLSWKVSPGMDPLPFEPVVYFAGFMSILGFVTRGNAVASIIGGLLNAILTIGNRW